VKKETKNIFSQSYQQHDSDVDPAAIWAGIGKKKKKSRGIVWWLFGSSLFVVALVAYLFLGAEVQADSNFSAANQEKETKVSNLSTNTKKDVSETFEKENINDSNLETQTQSQSQSQTQSQSQNNLGNGKKEINTIKKSQEVKISENIQIKKANPESRIEKNDLSKTYKNAENKVSSPTQVNDQSDQGIFNKVIVDKKLGKAVIEKQPIAIRTDDQKINEEEVLFETINDIDRLTNDLFYLDYSQELIKCYVELSPAKNQDTENELAENELKEKRFNKGTFGLSAMGTAGSFTDTYSGVDADYLSLRAETESPLESFGASLNISYQLNNFGIETGFNYLRSNRIMEWSGKYFGDSNGILLFTYFPNKIDGDLLTEADGSLGVFLYDRSLRKYNETHTLSIPISLSYSRSYGLLQLGVFAGAAFHVIQNHNVDVMGSDFVLIDQRMNLPEIKLRPDLMAGLRLNYKLNESISLRSQLGYRHRVIEESILNKRTTFYNLGIGIVYSW